MLRNKFHLFKPFLEHKKLNQNWCSKPNPYPNHWWSLCLLLSCMVLFVSVIDLHNTQTASDCSIAPLVLLQSQLQAGRFGGAKWVTFNFLTLDPNKTSTNIHVEGMDTPIFLTAKLNFLRGRANALLTYKEGDFIHEGQIEHINTEVFGISCFHPPCPYRTCLESQFHWGSRAQIAKLQMITVFLCFSFTTDTSVFKHAKSL